MTTLAGLLHDLRSDIAYLHACDRRARGATPPEALHEGHRQRLYAALRDGVTVRELARLVPSARAYRAMAVFDEPWAVDAGVSMDCTLRWMDAEWQTARMNVKGVAA
jgi:hypothetical protein